jgi:hypothetical protein
VLHQRRETALRFAKCTPKPAVREFDCAVDQPVPRAHAQTADGIQIADQQLCVALFVRL